jgi:hypothetical protein
VPASVEQNIGDRVPDLARRPQNVNVAAVGKNPAGSSKDPIHGPRKARGDGLQPASQVARAARLDDQMNMVVLDRVVSEAKSATVAGLSPASLQLLHFRTSCN